MAATDLFEDHEALLVEKEGGWISGFMWCVPPQPVEVRQFVVGVSHENDVGRQVSLFFEELPRVLVQIGGRSRIDEEYTRILGRKVRGVLNEVVDLPHTVGALIAGIA